MSLQPTRRAVISGAAAAAALAGQPAYARSAKRPNILLIFPDQLRAMALSVYGEKNIQTSTFDKLVRASCHFNRAYTADPVCAPARASLLTGLYPTRHGLLENGERLDPKIPTVSSRLSDAGYDTGYIGKWHLDDNTIPGFVPPSRRHGFKHWRAYNSGHHWRHSVYFADNDTPLKPSPANTFEPFYQTDLALDFIGQRREAPWFLMMAYGPPHPPGRPPVRDWSVDIPSRYLVQVDPKAIRFNPNVPRWAQSPNRGAKGKDDQHPGARKYLHGYYASVLGLQDAVTRLLDGLDASGQANNTLVVLASDHGEMGGAHGQFKNGQPFEEALRVPLSFRWPGVISTRKIEVPVSLVDVSPTLLSIAGATPLSSHGQDLSGTLMNGAEPARKSVVCVGRQGKRDKWTAIRGPRFTYAEQQSPDGMQKILYDNAEDPWQQENVAGKRSYKKERNRLAARLRAEHRRIKRT
ncbi:MAG: sulfatase-like hydrolase/transferase [Rhodobacterales bacterium]|nr:sulfatase-like hydrolase/transferase [Rhodobacterales bacterium]